MSIFDKIQNNKKPFNKNDLIKKTKKEINDFFKEKWFFIENKDSYADLTLISDVTFKREVAISENIFNPYKKIINYKAQVFVSVFFNEFGEVPEYLPFGETIAVRSFKSLLSKLEEILIVSDFLSTNYHRKE